MQPANSFTLRQRVVQASSWTVAGYGVTQVLRLGTNLIMTRLLMPDMFGVMAIASMFMVGLALFSDLGISQNVVQSRRGNDPGFLNTAWSVKILRGVVIWLLALMISLGLYLADAYQLVSPDTVYADDRLPEVFAVYSITALIQGFESNRLPLAWRRLELGRATLIDIASLVACLLTMLIWVELDRSIWALVAGGIVGQLSKTLLSHSGLLTGPGDRWAWEPEALAELYNFGKWVFLSSMLWFLVMNGDRLILGGLVGPDILGMYSIAYLLAFALQQLISRVFSGVAFPALSEIVRDSPQKLKATYYKIRLRTDFLALFASGSLFVLGEPIVHLLYDQRYWDAGPMLGVLALALAATRYEVADQCYLALGFPKWLTFQNAIRTVVLFLLVPMGFYLYQLDGAIWAVVLSMFSVVPLTLYVKFRLGILDMKKELIVLPFFILGWLFGEMANWALSAVAET